MQKLTYIFMDFYQTLTLCKHVRGVFMQNSKAGRTVFDVH